MREGFIVSYRRSVVVMECEVYVEVMVKGPKNQLETYMNWLAQSKEYGTRASHEKTRVYALTSGVKQTYWKFSSSNIRNKIKIAKLRQRGSLSFTVNYSLQRQLAVEDLKTFQSIYESDDYRQLVMSFQPYPLDVKQMCPDLAVSMEWGSYFIEDKEVITKYDESVWCYRNG